MATPFLSVATAFAQQAGGAQQPPGGILGFMLGPFGMMIIKAATRTGWFPRCRRT